MKLLRYQNPAFYMLNNFSKCALKHSNELNYNYIHENLHVKCNS